MKITTFFLALAFLFSASIYAQVDLSDGLVASYSFTGNANDVSGNGNDGTVTAGHEFWGAGTPVLTTDRFGNANQAYSFDMGGNIEVPYTTILNPGSMSLSWWVYMEEQDNNDYMISMNRWGCYKVNLQTENKVFFTTKVENPDVAGEFIYHDRDHAGDGLVAETWYHLAVTFGAGHMKFYIDGVMVKDWDDVTDAPVLDISSEPINLTFGQDLPTATYSTDDTSPYYVNWGGFFKGKLDDINVYNRVLNAEEVMVLNNAPNLDGLVAYYPFNGNADDESGNGNDGTVTMGHEFWGAGTPTLTQDRNGNHNMAYYFDMGGNIEVPYTTILNPASMSLAWWVYMEEQDNNDYMISMNRWNSYKVNLQTENKVFFTTKVENPDVAGEFIYHDRDHAGDGLVAETWYHLAVTFGAGHMKFYIDGVMVKDWDDVTDAPVLDISSEPVNLTFGQDLPTATYSTDDTSPYYVNWGGFFKGKLDDIYMFNRVLTDDDVTSLFNMYVSAEELNASINRNFELQQNYPNPFNSSTTIKYSQRDNGFTTLKIYNILGEEVSTLVSQQQNKGNYEHVWNASKLKSGVYFGRLTVNGKSQTKKLFLLK